MRWPTGLVDSNVDWSNLDHPSEGLEESQSGGAKRGLKANRSLLIRAWKSRQVSKRGRSKPRSNGYELSPQS
jgi:hypothetical protein